MGVYLKNKPSSLTSVISESILQYILMLMLAMWLILPLVLDSGNPKVKTVILEFGPDVTAMQVEAVWDELADIENIIQSSLTPVYKEDAFNLMKDEMSEEMQKRLKADNPFRDMIKFDLDHNLDVETLIPDDMLLDGVYESQAIANNGTKPGVISAKVSVPFTIVSLILFLLYQQVSIKRQVADNVPIMSSLINYGANPDYTTQTIFSESRKASFFSWIIALLLFFLTFYLILGILAVEIGDLSIERILLVILLPLIISLIIKGILMKNAVTVIKA